MTLTRELILARKTGRGTVTLSDGGQVTIRALTRDEALAMQDLESTADRDNYIISTGMVAPKLSPEDVAVWAANDSAGELVKVSEGIAELSGMMPKAGKAATKSAARRS
jgi:hypothetical protein